MGSRTGGINRDSRRRRRRYVRASWCGMIVKIVRGWSARVIQPARCGGRNGRLLSRANRGTGWSIDIRGKAQLPWSCPADCCRSWTEAVWVDGCERCERSGSLSLDLIALTLIWTLIVCWLSLITDGRCVRSLDRLDIMEALRSAWHRGLRLCCARSIVVECSLGMGGWKL
jgi:hypothetical protein